MKIKLHMVKHLPVVFDERDLCSLDIGELNFSIHRFRKSKHHKWSYLLYVFKWVEAKPGLNEYPETQHPPLDDIIGKEDQK
jgi:hypothetical protein